MKYKNSSRIGDVRVENLSKDEIIEILYERLKESDETLKSLRGMLTSSFGTKDICDYNGEILNPLWKTFNETNN